jgi:PPOX class probable F420-dependent enzyme
MYSDSTAGKVKRLRHTPHVTLAPCNAQGRLLEGETVRGSAHLLETAEDIALAQRAIQRKYGWRYLGYHLLNVAMQRVRPQKALQFSWIAIRLHDAHEAMTTWREDYRSATVLFQFEGQDAMQPRELFQWVITIAACHINYLRLQQTERVIMTQHPPEIVKVQASWFCPFQYAVRLTYPTGISGRLMPHINA